MRSIWHVLKERQTRFGDMPVPLLWKGGSNTLEGRLEDWAADQACCAQAAPEPFPS
jgi:hypothetical protein